MTKVPIFGLILAGGKSSRLYPFNKVLSDLTGTGKSLLQQSFDRLGLPRERTYVLTVRDMVAPIRKQLRFSPGHIFVDPVRRGTWPAILWAMAHLQKETPDAVLAIVTGDHVIEGQQAFRNTVKKAVEMATKRPAIVMLGIPPTTLPTEWRSFGCFRADPAGQIIGFEEKPTSEHAQSMIDEGNWMWNAGMFFFRLSTARAALRQFQPEMFRVYQAMSAAIAAGKEKAAAKHFEDFPDKIPHAQDPKRLVDNSIDYAIMTPLVGSDVNGLEACAVPNGGFQWTDLGQWDALRKVMKADRAHNIHVGKVQLKNVQSSILVAEKGHDIQCSDVQHLIVAFAHGTALVMSEDRLPSIKEIIQQGKRLTTAGVEGITISLRGKRLVVSGKPRIIR